MNQKCERDCTVTERVQTASGGIVRSQSFDLTQAGEAQAAQELLQEWVGEHRQTRRSVTQDASLPNVAWLAQDGQSRWMLQIEMGLCNTPAEAQSDEAS